MLQPTTPLGVLFLLLMTSTAQAQSEVPSERSLTLPGNPGAPLPEVRVRASVPTLLLFDALIDRASVQLDATRVRLVDVGERSLIIEPRVSPGAQEQWVLRVRYANGVASEEWAAFALVSRPEAVDMRIDVVRGQKPLEACQAQLAEAKAHGGPGRAEAWVLADRLGGRAVQSAQLGRQRAERKLEAQEGVVYRLATGVLLVLLVKNGPGQPAWAPTKAALQSANEPPEAVAVRTVALKEGPIPPGAVGWVAVEAALPSPAAGSNHFTLGLRDASGRILTVTNVPIPEEPPQMGGKK